MILRKRKLACSFDFPSGSMIFPASSNPNSSLSLVDHSSSCAAEETKTSSSGCLSSEDGSESETRLSSSFPFEDCDFSTSSDDRISSSSNDELNFQSAEETAAFWRKNKYTHDTKVEMNRRFSRMHDWLTSNESLSKMYLPITFPFQDELCIQYLRYEMSRDAEKSHDSRYLSKGAIYQTILMLIYKGFTEHGLAMSPVLRATLFNGLESHAQSLADLMNEGRHPVSRAAQIIPWAAIEYAASNLHSGSQDYRAHGYFLLLFQSLSRGERVGKIPNASFELGEGGDHIHAGKGMTSKKDKKGIRSYSKRYVPNPLNPSMCFLTWLGVHIMTCKPEDYGHYLFMNYEEELQYAINLSNSQNVPNKRSRSFGPHLAFNRIVSSVFKSGTHDSRAGTGLSDLNVSQHSGKKGGFAHLLGSNAVSPVFVEMRAEHSVGNVGIYGSHPISGVQKSGGPPASIDFLMGKVVSGNDQYSKDFNMIPAHWDSTVISKIPFEQLIPCFEKLQSGMKDLLPLILAQVVHHYHFVKKGQGLCSHHPLFRSALWTTHVELRHSLHLSIRGGLSQQSSVLKSNFTCRVSEQYNWLKKIHDQVEALTKGFGELHNIALESHRNSIEALKSSSHIETILQNSSFNNLNRFDDVSLTQPNLSILQQSSPSSLVSVHVPGHVHVPVHENDHYDEQSLPSFCSHQESSSNEIALELQAAPCEIDISNGICVEAAFHAWHGSTFGSFPWSLITTSSLCLPIVPEKRRRVLQLLSKIRKIVKFIQGSTPNETIKLDVSHAWVTCKSDLLQVLRIGPLDWPFHGSVCYAYAKLLHLCKDKSKADECHNRIVELHPNLRQTSITSFFDDKNALLLPDIEINFSDSCEFQLPLNQMAPPSECLICPICPDIGGQQGCRVVYQSFESLWQHWRLKHVRIPQPPSYSIHRVSGMKSAFRKSASWVRSPGAMSYLPQLSQDDRLHQLRKNIIDGVIFIDVGTYIEVHPDKNSRSIGDRWFGMVRDGNLDSNNRIKVKFCLANCLAIDDSRDIVSLSVQCIIQVGLKPFHGFDGVPFVVTVTTPVKVVESTSPFIKKKPKISSYETPITLCKVVLSPESSIPIDDFPMPFDISSRKFQARVCNMNPSWIQDSTELPLSSKLMLRDVSGLGKCCPTPIPPAPSDNVIVTMRCYPNFRLVDIKNVKFINDDYGSRFSSNYPIHVQHTLHTFNLDESNRCFFLSLGIATGHDPFTMQCLFRKHSRLLVLNKSRILNFLSDESFCVMFQAVEDVLVTDNCVDSNILCWCWPPEFDHLRIFILCVRQGVCHTVIYEHGKSDKVKRDIFLYLKDMHYTVLNSVHGDCTCFNSPESRMHFFLHDYCPDLRSPSIQSLCFDTHSDVTSYITSSLHGRLPTPSETESVWLRATQQCGLEYDFTSFRWTVYPDSVETSKENQHGSMHPDGWADVHTALIGAFHEAPPTRALRSRNGCVSPLRSSRFSNDSSSVSQCTFVDAGFEAGGGLFRVGFQNSNITHIAGVELQTSWFQVSVQVYERIREICKAEKFRMPQVSLFNSCMLADSPEIHYLYSAASVMWMNNFVFDIHPYFKAFKPHSSGFNSHKDVRNAPLSFLPPSHDARSSLSANAAFTFSRHFKNSTCIAVHHPQYFSSEWNYVQGNKPLSVSVTWGQTQANVSVVRNFQHILIRRGCKLVCATQEDVNCWENFMRLWEDTRLIINSYLQKSKSFSRQLAHSDRISKELLQNPFSRVLDCDSSPSGYVDPDLVKLLPQPPFKHSTLNLQDISCLMPLRCLPDAIIDEYSNVLRSSFQNIHFPKISFDIVHLEMEIRGTLRSKKQFVSNYFQHLKDDSQNSIIFALNPGHHWVAFKIDRVNRQIVTMDSLQSRLSKEVSVVRELLSSVWSDIKLYKHTYVSVPHQQNPFDCGVHTCMFMLFLAESIICDETELTYCSLITARDMRLRIFADIRKNKLTRMNIEL